MTGSTQWVQLRLDRVGRSFVYESMEYAYPWPANAPDLRGLLLDSCRASNLRNIVGVVAPLTVTTASGPLVFHDCEVVDPEPGRCRTGNMGVRAIPASKDIEARCQVRRRRRIARARVERGRDGARFRAVYAPASPDVSAPLITVDTPRDCWQIPHGATATVSFSCRDLGSGVASCTVPPGYENGATIDTSLLGDFSFAVIATESIGTRGLGRCATAWST